jgi:hypothetical protein
MGATCTTKQKICGEKEHGKRSNVLTRMLEVLLILDILCLHLARSPMWAKAKEQAEAVAVAVAT